MTHLELPALPEVRLDSLPQPLVHPTPLIKTEEDVDAWHLSQGYNDYCLFVRRLNEAVVGYNLPAENDEREQGEAVTKMLEMLDVLHDWIDEIPPLKTPQRFGNVAFRNWGKRLEEHAHSLLHTLLPPTLHPSIPLLLPYFVTSFGSFTRIDYGSGHELSFAILLLLLTLLRFFHPTPEEERSLVLVVFRRYLKVVWKLQDVYMLEPAGSHGVWGLDDYHFLTYLWGSAQLRDSTPTYPPSSILCPPLPPTNLYNLSISRIHLLKHGPFHEHSSQLYAIATSVPNWGKVNVGLWKMYVAEVLSKRVVVQHIPIGGLFREGRYDAVDEMEAITPTPTPRRSASPVGKRTGGVSLSKMPATSSFVSRAGTKKTEMGPPPSSSAASD